MESSDGEEEIHQSQKTSAHTRKSNRSPPYALFNLLVIVVAIIYGAYYQLYVKDTTESSETTASVVEESDDDLVKISMFTAEELKKYNGEGEC